MKSILGLSLLIVAAFVANTSAYQCTIEIPGGIQEDWKTMNNGCITSMKNQIQAEINAAYKYLELAAYFSQDSVNRPGFAEMFFKAAREEREHAMKLIEYMSMRGELTDYLSNLITAPKSQFPEKMKLTGVQALETALAMEVEVTKSIQGVIDQCDSKANNQDYHLVDYLTGVYLEEQYKGQREIAGKLSILKRMIDQDEGLAEFLFDKRL